MEDKVHFVNSKRQSEGIRTLSIAKVFIADERSHTTEPYSRSRRAKE